MRRPHARKRTREARRNAAVARQEKLVEAGYYIRKFIGTDGSEIALHQCRPAPVSEFLPTAGSKRQRRHKARKQMVTR